ncbi:Mutator mutT protein [Nostoc sphaeroides CCNUC1]|uniref:Mutator mutT protein n=1 Tax=Nostoc sphaeroides CCNUC1 TaxID=2653204 RepID=A0A5P8W343_9NOSO|nr:Mutator mutT protein [Nostoc sphaeroides CCNUC1]
MTVDGSRVFSQQSTVNSQQSTVNSQRLECGIIYFLEFPYSRVISF